LGSRVALRLSGLLAAAGRKATWTVMIMGRFTGDKLAEDWVEYHRYNLFS
jgi:hypothetical protein